MDLSKIEIPDDLNTPDFVEVVKDFVRYRAEIKKPATQTVLRQIFVRARSYGPAEASRRLRVAMANGWQGWDFGDAPANGAQANGKPAETKLDRLIRENLEAAKGGTV